MPDLTLAELLCSRLCHDLIGPVTAVAHGIEFLADDDPSMRQQALDLMGKSAAQGAARLQFYRCAFGQAAGAGESIPRAEVAGLVAGLLQGGKVEVAWGAGTGDPSRLGGGPSPRSPCRVGAYPRPAARSGQFFC